jgi:hypothetical protein
MNHPCVHCGKSLRKCKRVDIVGREIHYYCIEKIRKQKWQDDYELLRLFLASKNIKLVGS